MAGLVVLAVLFYLLLFVGSIAGLVASGKTRRLREEMTRLTEDVKQLQRPSGKERIEQEKPPHVIEPEPWVVAEPPPPPPPKAESPVFPSPAKEPEPARPLAEWIRRKTTPDREWLKNLEEAVGRRWITWAGALVLFVSAAFFVKYAFDRRWLGPTARVIFGIIAGLAASAAGERFIRRNLLALGQGLVGAGLAILYASLYAAYAYYHLLPQPVSFALMTLVTVGGMTLAAVHNAIPVGFLAVLGGFLTPVMLRTGADARDALFAYLLLLDVGVLGLAFVRRWRALDILSFVGTAAYFTGWFFQYYTGNAITPTTLWLGAFYVVFVIQPFVYHLRLGTPIVGERFALAVSNAGGMFIWLHTLLYPDYKHVFGFVTLGMSASYLLLGVLSAKRIKNDRKAILGFLALSVMFLTIAVPIHFDLQAVTLLWAVEGPVLLFLSYKYRYFPVRLGSLVPPLLSTLRIFVTHWPLHERAFSPVFNSEFGTVMFVPLAWGAYAIVHHVHRGSSSPVDGILKISTAIASGFLALIVMHAEVWQWLDLSGRGDFVFLAAVFVWVAGSAAFLTTGMLLGSFAARVSGLVALFVATILETWDYYEDLVPGYLLFLNGRFLAGIAGIAVVFAYAFIYLRSKQRTRPDEQRQATSLFGIVIAFLLLLITFEIWQWLTFHGYNYTARCLLPPVWAAGAAAFLASGIRLRCPALRETGLVALAVSAVLAGVGYEYRIGHEYLLYLNLRFAATLAVPFMTFAHAYTLRRLRDLCHLREAHESEALYGIGIFLVTVLMTVETSGWLCLHGYYYASRCLLPLIWTLGAGAYLAAGMRLRLPRLRTAGIAVLCVAGILAARGYYFYMTGRYALYLNGRFLAALAVVLAAFAQAFVLRRLRSLSAPGERAAARVLNGIATALLLLLLSVETPTYFLETMSHPVRARWAAQTSLSILWGVYATVILAFGFWRNIRSLRLSALGLFGLTALKLVIVDMAKVREVYRIVSFFVLGVLMIAASYLYHRVEKRLEASTAGQPQGPQEKT